MKLTIILMALFGLAAFITGGVWFFRREDKGKSSLIPSAIVLSGMTLMATAFGLAIIIFL